jgi:Family of unknown function (DUF6302)
MTAVETTRHPEVQVEVQVEKLTTMLGQTDNPPVARRLEDERARYARLLAEPELLDETIVITNVFYCYPELAIPVGKLRRGGHIVASGKRQAQKAARLLAGYPGFPKPRVVKSSYYSQQWEVVWGDPPPFDDLATDGAKETIMRGIHFGYSDEAIAGFIVPQRGYTRMRREVLGYIRSERTRIEPNASLA